MQQVKRRAKWIGVVTHNANSATQFPFSDSESARWRADANQRRKREARQGIDGRKRRKLRKERKELSAQEGGHTITRVATGRGWLCVECKERSTIKWRLAARKCSMRKDRWMTNGGEAGARAVEDGTRQHVLRKSGTVTWCGACGAFAESRARRLMTVCNGAPRVGGPKAQLLLLRASVHPVTKLQLPQATWLDGSAIEGAGTYSRRQSGEQRGDDEDFVRYVPEVLPVAVPRNGASAAVKRDRLLLKVRAREV